MICFCFTGSRFVTGCLGKVYAAILFCIPEFGIFTFCNFYFWKGVFAMEERLGQFIWIKNRAQL
jgi:hypothetical protein